MNHLSDSAKTNDEASFSLGRMSKRKRYNEEATACVTSSNFGKGSLRVRAAAAPVSNDAVRAAGGQIFRSHPREHTTAESFSNSHSDERCPTNVLHVW